MSILLISDDLSAEYVVECILWREDGLNETIPGVHLLVWVELLPEKEIAFIGCRGGGTQEDEVRTWPTDSP